MASLSGTVDLTRQTVLYYSGNTETFHCCLLLFRTTAEPTQPKESELDSVFSWASADMFTALTEASET